MQSWRIDMASGDELIRGIVSRSGLWRSRAKRELERELRAHLEDASDAARSAGHDEADILPIVCERFGNPDEIIAGFERLHRFERRSFQMADAIALMGISVLTVAALILTLQLTIAFRLGISPSHAFPRLRGELVAFVSLSW